MKYEDDSQYLAHDLLKEHIYLSFSLQKSRFTYKLCMLFIQFEFEYEESKLVYFLLFWINKHT